MTINNLPSTRTNNTEQAFWIALGGLFSFGFGMVSSMILSRYFSKQDYGTYKQVLYVYTTLLAVFTLGLPNAFSYFLPRVSENQAKNLIKKITNLFFLLGGIFSLLLFLFADQIAGFLKNGDLAFALKVFSPVPLLMLPTMGLDGILSTYRVTKFMAIYTISTRIVMLLCVAAPVMLFGGGYIQAIMGFVIASFFSFILALFLKYYPVRSKGKEPCNKTYKEIFQFSLPLLFASFWGILISSADQFFISRYFGSKVFAEFSNGATDLPFVGMIVGATSTVLSPIFSRMSHEKLSPKKEIFPVWKSVFEKSAMLIYPILIYSWFFADFIMVLLYGPQYSASSIYFRIKMIVNFFTLIAYAPLIINIGKVKYYAIVHMWGAFVLIIIEYFSILVYNSPFFLITVSVICQLGRIYFMLWAVARFFGTSIYHLFPLKVIIKIILPSILILSLDYYLIVIFLKLNEILTVFISFSFYFGLFMLYSSRVKMNYCDLMQPLIIKLKR